MSQERRKRRASERDQENLKKIFGWIEPWFEEALFKASDDWNYTQIWKVAHQAWRELANTWNRRYPGYPEQHVHQHRATPKNDDAIQLGDSLVGHLFHFSRVASVNSAMAA